MLAGRTQTVISHLWSVQPIPAAAFGALLALGVRAQPDHLAACGHALGVLASGRDAVLDALDGEPCAHEITERVRNNDVPWSSVITWGPILVT